MGTRYKRENFWMLWKKTTTLIWNNLFVVRSKRNSMQLGNSIFKCCSYVHITTKKKEVRTNLIWKNVGVNEWKIMDFTLPVFKLIILVCLFHSGTHTPLPFLFGYTISSSLLVKLIMKTIIDISLSAGIWIVPL